MSPDLVAQPWVESFTTLPAMPASFSALVAATHRGGATSGAAGVQLAAFTVKVNADGSVTFTAHDVIDT
jgi:hypothetical protein